MSTVAVVFSMAPDLSVEMAEALALIFPEPPERDGMPIRFLLKAHPRLPLRSITRRYALPRLMEETQQPLSDLFQTVDLALYVPQTATWAEALSAGVPVLRYRGDFLDIDAAEDLGVTGIASCTAMNLRAKLLGMLGVGRSRPLSRAALSRVYDIVHDGVWRNLLSSTTAEVEAAAES